jgi:mRNA-degrading endonuclease toxin of MazEF toxin-antitoxin module
MKKTPELFDQWNEQKKRIEFGVRTIEKIADIWEFWWYSEGINVGNEISKDGFFKRTCLILQNQLWNWLYLIAPLTTKYHYWMKDQYFPIENCEKKWLKKSWILLNQIKLIDWKRLCHTVKNKRHHGDLANKVCEQYYLLIKKAPLQERRRPRH